MLKRRIDYVLSYVMLLHAALLWRLLLIGPERIFICDLIAYRST